jgi:anti-sigma B factor antagonist
VDARGKSNAESLVMTVAWAKDGTAVIALSGELDISTAPRLQRRVVETAQRTPGDVRLDAASLRFCDAAGLSAITAAAEELRRSGRRLHIDHPPAHLLRVLEITDLRYLVG